jgi:hypothetical protein
VEELQRENEDERRMPRFCHGEAGLSSLEHEAMTAKTNITLVTALQPFGRHIGMFVDQAT